MADGVWRWYTKARRVPTLIGKDSSGHRIPGGPYTALQVGAAPVVPTLLWQTRGLWAGQLSVLAVVVAVAALSAGTVKLLGKVDFAARNPLYLAASFARQAFGPVGGRSSGRPLKVQPVCRVASRAVVATATVDVTASEALACAVPMARAEPMPARSKPVRVSTAGATQFPVTLIPEPAAAAPAPPPAAAAQPTPIRSSPVVAAARQSGLEAFLSAGRRAA